MGTEKREEKRERERERERERNVDRGEFPLDLFYVHDLASVCQYSVLVNCLHMSFVCYDKKLPVII